MLKFNFQVKNADAVFFALQTPLRDFSGLWDQYHGQFQGFWQQQFASEGATGQHGEWAPLSEGKGKAAKYGGYRAWKARHYPGMPILERTGELLNSFLGGAGHVFESSPMSMQIGSDLAIASYHQTGTSRGLPARRIIDLNDQQVGALRTTAARYVMQKYRAAGFRVLGAGADVGEAKAAGKAWYESGGTPLSEAA